VPPYLLNQGENEDQIGGLIAIQCFTIIDMFTNWWYRTHGTGTV